MSNILKAVLWLITRTTLSFFIKRVFIFNTIIAFGIYKINEGLRSSI